MKRESAEQLQWYVDFANRDLQSLSRGEKAKLLVDAEEYLWPGQEIEEMKRYYLTNHVGKQLGPGMVWALKMPSTGSPEFWEMIVKSQKSIQVLFRNYLIPTLVVPNAPSPTAWKKPQRIAGRDEIVWWAGWGPAFPFGLKIFYITRSQKDYVGLKIIRSLLSLPAPSHSIKICPGCEKYFVNPTARKKDFCSARCMAKILTRRRREADREGYLKYQAKLMRDRRREEKGLPRRKTKARKKRKAKG